MKDQTNWINHVQLEDIKMFLSCNDKEINYTSEILYASALSLLENGDYDFIPESILNYLIFNDCSNLNPKEREAENTELEKELLKNHNEVIKNFNYVREIPFDEIELFLSANDVTVPYDTDLAYKLASDIIRENKYVFMQDALIPWQNILMLGKYDTNIRDVVNINYISNLSVDLLYRILSLIDPRSIILLIESNKSLLSNVKNNEFRKLLHDKIGGEKLSINQLCFYAKCYNLRKHINLDRYDSFYIITKKIIYNININSGKIYRNDNKLNIVQIYKRPIYEHSNKITNLFLNDRGLCCDADNAIEETLLYNFMNLYSEKHLTGFSPKLLALDFKGVNYTWSYLLNNFENVGNRNIIQHSLRCKLDINGDVFSGHKILSNVVQITDCYALLSNGEVYNLLTKDKVRELCNIKQICDYPNYNIIALNEKGEVYEYSSSNKECKKVFNNEKVEFIEIFTNISGIILALTENAILYYKNYHMKESKTYDLNCVS